MATNICYKLGNGASIQALGFGTWMAKDAELENALEAALEAGYRHIDTAFVYENEKVIGKVLKKFFDSGKLKREDLFIVSKLPPIGHHSVEKFINKSLSDMQIDYLDLYLIHTPFAFAEKDDQIHPMAEGKIMLDKTNNHITTWKAMEDQVDAGRAKAIGLSNFNETQVQKVISSARIKPTNLQVELHAYHQQKPLVEFCKKNGIAVTAYSPLGSPGLGKLFASQGVEKPLPNILHNPTIEEIAKKHGKSTAQVVLRHGIQKGLIVIPKSTNEKRLKENLDVFSFELDSGDMQKLNDLDQGQNGRILDFTMFPGIQEHPEYPFH